MDMSELTTEVHTIEINIVHDSTRKAPLEENFLTLYLHFMMTRRQSDTDMNQCIIYFKLTTHMYA